MQCKVESFSQTRRVSARPMMQMKDLPTHGHPVIKKQMAQEPFFPLQEMIDTHLCSPRLLPRG